MRKIKNIVIILIAIMLLGMMPTIVYASGAVQQIADIFNSRFLDYEGEQSAASTQALLTAIESNNSNSTNQQIEVKGIADTPSAAKDKIETSKKYKVSFEYGLEGFISAVTIEEDIEIIDIPSQPPVVPTPTQAPINNVVDGEGGKGDGDDLPETGLISTTIIMGTVIAIVVVAFKRFRSLSDI